MEINRAVRPKSKIKPVFHLPTFKSGKINNGIEYSYATKTTLPIVSLSITVNVGSMCIPDNKSGLSYITGMLLLKGAGKYNALELTEKFQSLGISLSIGVEPEYFSINILSLKENLEEGFSLLADILLKPHFSDFEFDLVKKSMLTQLTHAQIDPGFIAAICLGKVVSKNTSFVHPLTGYPDTISNITNEDVKELYKNYYTPNNSKISITGNITAEEIEELLNKYLGGWEPGKKTAESENKYAIEEKGFYFTNLDNAPQSIIEVGMKIPARNNIDINALILANDILGGNFTSRLNKNLREDKGFTYGISSNYQFTKETGVFFISSSVDGKNTVSALKEILVEINNFYDSITQEELDFAKAFIVNHFPANFETYSKINGRLKNLIRYDLDLNYYQNYVDSILNVSLNDVQSFIKRTFYPDNFQVYVCGDKNNFINELNEIGFNEYTELNAFGDPIVQ